MDFREKSVKIGKDRKWSKNFRCFPENVGWIPLAVAIMTTANVMHPTFPGRHPKFCFFYYSRCLLSITEFIYCSFHLSLSRLFWRNLFYYLFYRSETFMMCINVFYITRNKNSVGSDKTEKLPHRPLLWKSPTFVTSCLYMTLQKWVIFIDMML